MKSNLISLCAAAAIAAFAGSASATISFGYAGPIKIKFSNWENLTVPAGCVGAGLGTACQDGIEDNYGILGIQTIVSDDGHNTILWSSGQGGDYLSGIFFGIDVHKISPILGGFKVESTGGFLNLYETKTPLNANLGTGGYYNGAGDHTVYTGVTNVPGSLYLALQFASGVNPLDPVTTISGNFDSTTLPTTGKAASFLNVIGGSAQSKFDADGFLTPFGARDMNSTSDFCTNGQVGCASPAQGNWDLVSEDPVRANILPEPGALALVGMALMGLGLTRRFGRKAA